MLGQVGARYVVFHLNLYDRRSRERLHRAHRHLSRVPAPAGPGRRRVALRDRRVPELALFVLAAVAHTWPLASAPGWWTRVDNADAALNAWAIAWVGITIVRAPLDLFNANIFYPEPRTLAFSEIMLPQALLGAPLTWSGADPVLVYNLLAIAGFALSGFAMSWLVSRWTGDRAAGVVAGLAYAFNAHTLVRFAHLQAMHVQYLPLAFFALHRTIESPNWRPALLLALALVLQSLDVQLPVADVGDRGDCGGGRPPRRLASRSAPRAAGGGHCRKPGARAVPLPVLARAHATGTGSHLRRRRGLLGDVARLAGHRELAALRVVEPPVVRFQHVGELPRLHRRGAGTGVRPARRGLARSPRANGPCGGRSRGRAGARRQPARLSHAVRVGAHPEGHPGRLAVGMADAVRPSDPGGLHPCGVEAPPRTSRRAAVVVAAACS